MSLLQAYKEEWERKETAAMDVSTDQRRHSTPPLYGRYDQLQKQPHLSPSGSVRPIMHNTNQLNIKSSWTEIYCP